MTIEMDNLLRMALIYILIVLAFILIGMNYSLQSVQSAALNNLYSITFRKNIKLELKLKVLGLIEKLSGPLIGIYC
jgi:hypothetical protein